MKNLVLALLLLGGFSSMMAQDHYFDSLKEKAEVKADSLTEIYSQKLGLTPKQALLFKTKAANFLMMREEVKNEYEGKEKLEKLLQVDTQENGEMLDILTKPQFEKYKVVKAEMQPLARVKD